MTPDPYRQAYEKAVEDLTLISQKFEQLSTRKMQVESLLTAFQPILARFEHAGQESLSHATVGIPEPAQQDPADTLESAEPPGGYSFLDVPAPLPTESDGDPFQRRVRAGGFRFKGLTAQRSY